MSERADLVVIGAGPKTTGVLLALAATPDAGRGLTIHLIDPYPAGAGRIWRTAQSEHLWMNSRAEDVTIFPDASCLLECPPVAGPTLDEWIHGEGQGLLAAAGLGAEADALTSQSFPSRRIHGHYLKWAFERALERLAATVHVHRTRAEAIHRLPGGAGRSGFRVLTAEGVSIRARVVVSAQGHLDMEPGGAEAGLESAAERGRTGAAPLHYQRPGFTADLDLSDIRPGTDVLARGFGLAFIDLLVMVTLGRGGRFEPVAKDPHRPRLHYVPSGREPILWVGSRRGVPYSPKLGYSRAEVASAPGVGLHYLPRAVGDGQDTIDFRTVLGPLAELELMHAHYEHVQWSRGIDAGDLLEAIDARAAEVLVRRIDCSVGGPRRLRTPFGDSAVTAQIDALVARSIPDAADRFDLATLDRPLSTGRERTGSAGADLGAGEGSDPPLGDDPVRQHIEDRLARSADPHHSADLAVFEALVQSYVFVRRLVRAGRIDARDRAELVDGSFHSLFSFIGSGPPPERIEQLLAVHEAGLLRFLGPDLRVEITAAGFAAHSALHPQSRTFTTMIDARLARQSARAAADPVFAALAAEGAILLEDGPGAKLRTDADGRALDAGGRTQPGLVLLGPAVSGSTAEAFSRPRTNAPVFADNERIAGLLLDALGASAARGRVQAEDRCERALLAG